MCFLDAKAPESNTLVSLATPQCIATLRESLQVYPPVGARKYYCGNGGCKDEGFTQAFAGIKTAYSSCTMQGKLAGVLGAVAI